MFKQAIRKITCFLCAMICVFACGQRVEAAVVLGETDIIERRLTNIADAQCSISTKNGTVIASADVSGRPGTEKCRITLEVHKKQGNTWVKVASWTVTEEGEDTNINRSINAEKGTTYRAKASVTVWKNGIAESRTMITEEKTV